MIYLKTNEEIEVMREGGRRLAKILQEVVESAKVGVSTRELDNLAFKLIKEAKGLPSFLTVRNYNFATCLCVNDVVVHGLPSGYTLKSGDLLGIDIGFLFGGFNTDMAQTILVPGLDNKDNLGNDIRKKLDFLDRGIKALDEAIKQAIVTKKIGDISKKIQEIIEKEGYSCIRQLTGHGVGRSLHEKPDIPCYLADKKIEFSEKIEAGMTLAIEVIYNMGGWQVIYKNNDKWSISTLDGSLSATFEKTIAVTRDGPLILTA